jgi:hypothetical protein
MTTELEKIILRFIDNNEWRWDYISQNPNLTYEFIEKHLDEKCDLRFEGLSKNMFTWKE